VFCSSSCAATYYNTKRKIIKPCLHCKKLFHPHRGNRGRFCSHECSVKHHSQLVYSKIEDGTYQVNSYNQKVMRKYLIKTRGHMCEKCHNSEWLSEPIKLTVDHIDGNWKNNHLENVRLLCWNCHSMTPTFCGGNRNGTRTKRNLIYQAGSKSLKLEPTVGAAPT
jgi:hypothetical protein